MLLWATGDWLGVVYGKKSHGYEALWPHIAENKIWLGLGIIDFEAADKIFVDIRFPG